MQSRQTPYRTTIRWNSHAILLFALVAFNLIVGLVIAPDYGPNWDEASDVEYGRYALQAYGSERPDWEEYGVRKYYGPLYFMAQEWFALNVQDSDPSVSAFTAYHYLNFACFQLAILAFYFIARRIVTAKTALLITFLFALQPLYFGHGFINGKDTPFLAFFLASVAVGLSAAARLRGAERQDEGPPRPFWPDFTSRLRSEFRAAGIKIKMIGAASLALATLVGFDLYGRNSIIISSVQRLVRDAYLGQAWEPVNRLFAWMAQRAGELPLVNYTDKAEQFFLQYGPLFLLILALPFLVALHRVFPGARVLFTRKVMEIHRHGHTHLLLLGAVLVGAATSIRVIGPFAGVLVSIVYLIEHRGRAVRPLIVFWLVVAVTVYATWPYLWSDPLGRLQESLAFMANHSWRGYVLYMGEVTRGNELPWHFLPVLMLLQFTEPVWLLAAAAVYAGLTRSVSVRLPLSIKIILPLWFLTPLIPMSFRDVWLYDNFRQFLFVTPVIFLYAALGLDFILRRVQRPALQWLLAAALLLPGWVGILQLHPYQYVYYNSLVGGTRGAAGSYELDYWCTSYYDAILHLNRSLPQDSVVAFWGTDRTGQTFARRDLTTIRITDEREVEEQKPGVVALCSRANIAETFLPSGKIVATISVQGAPLTVIKQPAP